MSRDVYGTIVLCVLVIMFAIPIPVTYWYWTLAERLIPDYSFLVWWIGLPVGWCPIWNPKWGINASFRIFYTMMGIFLTIGAIAEVVLAMM